MTPSRPYLIRAIYEWIADNGMTPYISVNTEIENVSVPQDYVENGQIILDISRQATKNLRVGNDVVEFQARFGGKITYIYIPIPAVAAIFAQENGRGMVFSSEDIENYQPTTEPDESAKAKKKSHLRLVKPDDED